MSKPNQRQELNEYAEHLKINGARAMTNREIYNAVKDAYQKGGKNSGLSVTEAVNVYKGRPAHGDQTVAGDTAKTGGSSKESGSENSGSKSIGDKSSVTILPPAAADHNVTVSAPQIHLNVPAPVVNIEAYAFPGWWAMVAMTRDSLLWMIAGASAYATFGVKALRLAGL